MIKRTRPRPRINHPPPPLPFVSLGTVKGLVLELLVKGGNPYSIAKRLNKHRSTVLQHLKELERFGLTKKDNHLWSATGRGTAYLGGGFSVAGYEQGGEGTTAWLRQDRAHNLKIVVEVVECPGDDAWLGSWRKNDKLRNVVFYMQRFGEIVTTFTGKSLIFQLPSLLFEDSDVALSEAGRIAKGLIEKYEGDVPGLKLGSFGVKAQLVTQHHAIPFEPYAKWLHKHGISYRDDKIDVDASKTPELEFTDKEESHLHHTRYVEYARDIILNELPKPSEITKLLFENEKQLSVLQKSVLDIGKGQLLVSQQQLITTKQLSTLITTITPKQSKKYEAEQVRPDYVG